jgi:hypothetical protein
MRERRLSSLEWMATMSDITCPYCERESDCYDGDHFSEAETREWQCPECKKFCNLVCQVSVEYIATQASCRNGDEHAIVDSNSFPKVWGGRVRQHCSICQSKYYRRSATQEEIDKQIKDLGDSSRDYTERKKHGSQL